MAARSRMSLTVTSRLAGSGLVPRVSITLGSNAGSCRNLAMAWSLDTLVTSVTRGSFSRCSLKSMALLRGVVSARYTEMALAFVFSRATIWSSECRTSRRLPRASNTTQTMSTLATLTAAFRQKFCQALLKAKSMRFQSRCMVPSCILVSDNLATFNGDHPPPHHIDALAVMRRHHHRRRAPVDLEQQLDDLP